MNKSKKDANISNEELQVFLEYVLTNDLKDDKHAKQVKELSKKKATLRDVTVVLRALLHQQDSAITQLMTTVQVQQYVLEALGANGEMFEEAQDKYNSDIEAVREQMGLTEKDKENETPEKDE